MNEPVLQQEPTPDHGSTFWANLDRALESEASIATTATTQTPTVDVLAPRRQSRSVWPLVAAAAVLALAGLSVLVFRGGVDPATEVVSGSEERGVIPLDGPSTDDSDPDEQADPAKAAATSTTPIPTAIATPIPSVIPTVIPTEIPAATPAGDAQPAGPQNLDDLPTYELAAGNTSSQVFVPNVAFPDGARFLATSLQSRLSWFSIVDPATSCSDPAHAEIRSVFENGFDFALADPTPRFSGNISRFTPATDVAKIAWLADCDGQLDFYVADAGPVPGQASNIRLAWTGEGSSTNALMRWVDNEVTLNSIALDGEPFFVSVDTDTDAVTGTGVRPDVGEGTGRSSWIVGATPSGDVTWWNGNQTTETTSCDGQTLYVHSDALGWQPALVESADVAAVTAFALNPALSQVAFTDDCGGINTARVFLGTVRADGLISSVRTIDMSTWATGNVVLLQWEDPLTLRIHTDESNTNRPVSQFNYVFDDGRDNGVIVRLN